MNHIVVKEVLEELLKKGIKEFCVCPGGRNTPFVYALDKAKTLKVYYWPEERSCAFFALGRSRLTNRPVAIVTTSGTAAGEILPAAMEAHYTGVPLLLLTADRPRRFRGSGAPQTAEQVGLFGCYAHFNQDMAYGETCDLNEWQLTGPAHLNVCLEEPKDADCQHVSFEESFPAAQKAALAGGCHAFAAMSPIKNENHFAPFETFIQEVKHPLVVVSTLDAADRESAVQFLLHLRAPVYAEAISGIREDQRLQPLRIHCIENIWKTAEKNDYSIDGVLRIGGVPTARLWRDLEERGGSVRVCSISQWPFSGLSWGQVLHTPLLSFFKWAKERKEYPIYPFQRWRNAQQNVHQEMIDLFETEPQAEPSLLYFLSQIIPQNSTVYLGNSLPIREWDLAAASLDRRFQVHASRGLNGIDGQISTFLGLCQSECDNWAVIGDLTALYDMAGPWILPQLSGCSVNLVVVNNGGGKIFERMFALSAIQNCHGLCFESLARFWKLTYEKWEKGVPSRLTVSHRRLIEIIPDAQATARFWKKYNQILQI